MLVLIAFVRFTEQQNAYRHFSGVFQELGHELLVKCLAKPSK